MNDASTRVKVVPTRDKPLEQCAAASHVVGRSHGQPTRTTTDFPLITHDMFEERPAVLGFNCAPLGLAIVMITVNPGRWPGLI